MAQFDLPDGDAVGIGDWQTVFRQPMDVKGNRLPDELLGLLARVASGADDDRPARVATLSAVESTWDPLPVDAEVARQFARLVAALRAGGRRVPILDAFVALLQWSSRSRSSRRTASTSPSRVSR